MLPDRVSNPGPQTYESGALPIAIISLCAMDGIKILLRVLIRYTLFIVTDKICLATTTKWDSFFVQ